MKKKILALILVVLVIAALTGCSEASEPSKEELKTLLSEPITNSEEYTPESYGMYEEALSEAQELLDRSYISQYTLDSTVNHLKECINSLTPLADKSNLLTTKEKAVAIEKNRYLPSSVVAVEEALANADAIIEDANASQETVDKATADIEEAMDQLESKPDKTGLSSLIEKANTYAEETYTTSTYTVLNTAVVSAKTVLKDDTATQADVSSAEESLNVAINGLQKSKSCIWRISASLHCSENNHVGNDWNSAIYYNGESVSRSFEITARKGTSITLKGKAVENDSVPDSGSGSVTLKLKEGNTAEKAFYVRENRGRYSGNVAVWVLYAECELKERI